MIETVKSMDAEFKARWVKELRSGDYKQGKGYLHRVEQNSFCCLGVACDMIGAPSQDVPGSGGGTVYHWGESADSVAMPRGLADLLGLHTHGIIFVAMDPKGFTKEFSLADLNDAGFTFDEIADLIEYFL